MFRIQSFVIRDITELKQTKYTNSHDAATFHQMKIPVQILFIYTRARTKAEKTHVEKAE